MYPTNCYKKYYYYFYVDNENNFYCIKNYECTERFSKLITDKKKCIDKCINDDIYQYESENRCFLPCPNGTIYNENDKICFKIEKIENNNIYESKSTIKLLNYKIEYINEIINNHNKLLNNSTSDLVKSIYSNINTLKCLKTLFSGKGLKKIFQVIL